MQPAGPSSLVVGDIRLTLIPDGYHRCDPMLTFLGSTNEDWDAHAELLDEHGRVVMTMGALLAELPDGQRVLIDLGFGPRTVILAELSMEFWGGRLVASLAGAGLTPDDIDVVLYSHMHSDHVGWTADQHEATLTFGRARHVMHRMEWDYWFNRTDAGGPSGADIAALTDRVDLVDEEASVVPGITLFPDTGSHSRPLFLPRVIGNGTRGCARRRHPLPAPDQPSGVGLRRRRESRRRQAGASAPLARTRRTRHRRRRPPLSRCRVRARAPGISAPTGRVRCRARRRAAARRTGSSARADVAPAAALSASRGQAFAVALMSGAVHARFRQGRPSIDSQAFNVPA